MVASSGIEAFIPRSIRGLDGLGSRALLRSQDIQQGEQVLASNDQAFAANQRAADEQEFVREMQSIVSGATSLAPFIANGDLKGGLSFMLDRREKLGAGGGFNGTQDSDQAIELLNRSIAGDQQAFEQLATDVANTITLGQELFGVQQPEQFTLGPGQRRVDENGQVIAEAPFKPEGGFTLGEGQGRFDASGNPIASIAPATEQPSDADILRNRQGVRTVVDRVRKASGVDDIAPNAKTFSEAISRGTGAGDVVSIVTFAKMLDPGSVVREGEVDIIQRGDGIFGQLQTLLGQVSESGQVLSGPQRAELAALAQKRVDAARESFRSRLTVERQGFDGFVDPTFLDQQFNQDPFRDIGFGSERTSPTGRTATNPQTGERVQEMSDGTWVPVQ